MKRNFLLLFSSIFFFTFGCQGTANIEKNPSMKQDEYGKNYSGDELEGENCFPFRGYSGLRKISLSVKKETAALYSYNFPLELNVYVGRNLTEEENQRFSDYIPFLYLMVKSTSSNDWSEYTSIKLPKVGNNDYQFITYDFPSRYTYYEVYKYSKKVSVDVTKLSQLATSKKLNAKLELFFYDAHGKEKYSIENKEEFEKDINRSFDFSINDKEYGFFVD